MKGLKLYLAKGFDTSNLVQPFITFEASIHYYHHRTARDNLYSLLPCSRLIWILRNPLPRAVSEYLHQAVKSTAYPEFSKIITAELAAIRKCRNKQELDLREGFDNSLFRCLSKFKLKKFMLSTAFYVYFINAWLQKFPREQHYFLDYEEFRYNPQRSVEKISSFLGLNTPPLLNYTWKYNKANTRDGIADKKRSRIKLSSALRKEILLQVGPFVDELYELIKQHYAWEVDSLT